MARRANVLWVPNGIPSPGIWLSINDAPPSSSHTSTIQPMWLIIRQATTLWIIIQHLDLNMDISSRPLTHMLSWFLALYCSPASSYHHIAIFLVWPCYLCCYLLTLFIVHHSYHCVIVAYIAHVVLLLVYLGFNQINSRLFKWTKRLSDKC